MSSGPAQINLFQLLQLAQLLFSETGQPLHFRKLEGVHDLLYRLGPFERTILEGSSDPKQTGHLLLRPDQLSPLRMGRIVYSLPYAGWYRVQLEGLGSELGCCRASIGSFAPPGTQDQTILPPGEQVLVYCPRILPFGVILCSIPQIVSDPGSNFGDFIVQASNGGAPRDRYFRDLINLTQSGVLDFSQGNVVDSSALGEATWLAPTGLGLHIGPWLTFLRVDETCGLFLHYFNRLARLTGYNFDWRTAVSELQVRQDEGEAYVWQGWATYPWEALGSFRPGESIFRENSDADVLYHKAEAKLEPKEFLQAPFWRAREARGYLGQGFWREIVLPPPRLIDSNTVWTLDRDQWPLGVFREHAALDGAYLLASAHSLTFVKRLFLPAPVQRHLPEDPQGDSSANYRMSGLFPPQQAGSQDQPPQVQEPDFKRQTPWSELLWPLAWLDWQQFGTNWRSLHQFHYHAKDWSVPQEEDLPLPRPFRPRFEDLLSRPEISPPDPVLLPVDHRQQAEKYYPTCSGFGILPQGQIVLQGPAGEQIILGGGNIRIHCPGDIELCPGRKLIVTAGDDTVIKSFRSIDLTSATADVRLKAEYNLELLAGNSGQSGRLLLESKSYGIDHNYEQAFGEDIPGHGIILRADNSEVITYAGRTFTQSLQGAITFKAEGETQHPIHLIAKEFNAYLSRAAYFVFPSGDDPQEICKISASECIFPGVARFRRGAIIQSRGLIVSGGIHLVDGFIGAGNPVAKEIQIYDAQSQILDTLRQILDDGEEALRKLLELKQKQYELELIEFLFSDPFAGGEKFKEMAHFSLRTLSQYGLSRDFPLLQPLWQILAKRSGLPKWQEPPVYYQGEEMLPYPGKEIWRSSNLYGIDLVLVDAETGRGAERDPRTYGQGEILKGAEPKSCEEWLVIPP